MLYQDSASDLRSQNQELRQQNAELRENLDVTRNDWNYPARVDELEDQLETRSEDVEQVATNQNQTEEQLIATEAS